MFLLYLGLNPNQISMAKFKGTEGEAISLEEAVSLTSKYKKSIEKKPGKVRSHFFGREILEKMLAQENAVGIRMYHGLNNEGGSELVLVSVDAEGNDQEEGIIADRSSICPPDCGSTGRLNS